MSMNGNYESSHNNQPCSWFVRAIKWIPVLFIVAIIGWSYYAYVIQLCLFSVKTLVEQIFFLFFYHIVFVMFFWAYWQTVFSSAASVPAKFRLSQGEVQKMARAENAETYKRILENFAKDLPISNRTITGAIRFCDKCMLVKPDRAHHCSVCGMCVLKMDHHCPWVNNCVNFTNYKFFILFLGYALLYCIYVAATALRYFILFWEGELIGGMGRFHILFLFFVSVMFAISLVSLFGYHLYLVALNRTTLEAFRAPIFRVGGPDKNGYHLGHCNNIQEVFGDDRKRWLLPVFTSLGDGMEYPTVGHHHGHGYQAMADTSTINSNNMPTTTTVTITNEQLNSISSNTTTTTATANNSGNVNNEVITSPLLKNSTTTEHPLSLPLQPPPPSSSSPSPTTIMNSQSHRLLKNSKGIDDRALLHVGRDFVDDENCGDIDDNHVDNRENDLGDCSNKNSSSSNSRRSNRISHKNTTNTMENNITV